jgi:hypothetical protein
VLDVIDIQHGATSYRARLFYAVKPGAKQVPFQSAAAVMPIPAESGFQRRNAGWSGLASGSMWMGKNTPPEKNTPESGCETKAGDYRSPAGCRFWILNEISASRVAPLNTAPCLRRWHDTCRWASA